MEKIKMDENTEITGELIAKIIQTYGKKHIERFEKLEKYYRGKHGILERKVDGDKPNNQLVANYAKYITDISTGYFMGVPVTYESDDVDYLDDVSVVLNRNFEEDVNYELAKEMSICGVAYELVYSDEDTKVRFKELDHKTVIPIYSDGISEKLLFVIRFYEAENFATEDKTEKADVYTAGEIIYYEADGSEMLETDREDHQFGDVPVIEYVNNEERIGDFEVILSLIDSYNKAQSDTANDFEYFTDAYLVLIGMEGTDKEDIADLKKDRVLLLSEEGQAEWLTKEINDAATENFKNRLQQDIHRLSQIPNLTDEEFANNASGVSIRYKLWGIEQIASIKERKFKTGLTKRLKLITHFLNILGSECDCDDIDINFHRNVPENLTETINNAQALGSMVSEKTQLSMLPFVKDIDAEIERKREDGERKMGEVWDGATKMI